jgi:hypothetical protein
MDTPSAGAGGREPGTSPAAPPMTTMMFDTGTSRSVKRPRPVKSCTECRKRKLKCDRLCPCSQCQKSHRHCKYAAADPDGSDESDGEERRPAKRLSVNRLPPAALGSEGPPTFAINGSEGLFEELASRLERLEKLVVANSRDSAAGDRLSAPHHSPRIMISASPSTIRGLSVKGKQLRTRFFGQNSTRVLLNLVSLA